MDSSFSTYNASFKSICKGKIWPFSHHLRTS